MVKMVSLSNSVYAMLKALKGKEESFSEVITRYVSGEKVKKITY